MSKSVIWFTTPMQQRSKSGFIRDWLSATVLLPRQCIEKRTTLVGETKRCIIFVGDGALDVPHGRNVLSYPTFPIPESPIILRMTNGHPYESLHFLSHAPKH